MNLEMLALSRNPDNPNADSERDNSKEMIKNSAIEQHFGFDGCVAAIVCDVPLLSHRESPY